MENKKKLYHNWALYDWANSVYPLVITTAIFPIFYEKISSSEVTGLANDKVVFLGMEFVNTALISYVSSAMFLTVSFIIPLLSGIADYFQNKKKFLRAFYILGSFSCAGLYFFSLDHLESSMLIYFLAALGFWSSLVFYNAFLPEIAPIEDQDRLSAQGFAYGYVGGSVLLIFCLALIMVLGRDAQEAFILTGVWWLFFATYALKNIPEKKAEIKDKPQSKVIWRGFQELKKVWNEIKKIPRLKKYLSSFFVFSMGVQTVMIMAVYFGAKEISWADDDAKTAGLITSVLIIQFLAVGGSYCLSWLSSKWGNIKALGFVLILWCLICIGGLWVYTPFDFYVIAGCVGLVMGGVQSLARSTYAKLLPSTKDTASYFSFYDVLEKLGIVVGTFSYGFIEELTGSMRNSILALIVFFVIGLLLLLTIPKEEQTRLQPVKE